MSISEMGNRGIWTESMEEFMYYHHIRRHLAQIGIKVQQMQFTRIFHLSSAMIRNMSLFCREIRSASRIIVIFLDSTKKRTQNSVLRLWKSRGMRHQDSDLWSRYHGIPGKTEESKIQSCLYGYLHIQLGYFKTIPD